MKYSKYRMEIVLFDSEDVFSAINPVTSQGTTNGVETPVNDM